VNYSEYKQAMVTLVVFREACRSFPNEPLIDIRVLPDGRLTVDGSESVRNAVARRYQFLEAVKGW